MARGSSGRLFRGLSRWARALVACFALAVVSAPAASFARVIDPHPVAPFFEAAEAPAASLGSSRSSRASRASSQPRARETAPPLAFPARARAAFGAPSIARDRGAAARTVIAPARLYLRCCALLC
jgi:hypothetical protein